MKNIAILLFVAIISISCNEIKKQKTEDTVDVIDEQVVMQAPNASDVHFEQALIALSKNELKIAGKHLKEGVLALNKEVKDLTPARKATYDTTIKHLNDIAMQLEKGETVNSNALYTMMANAELHVAHNYLVTEDTYVLTEPTTLNESRLHKALEHNVKSLESGTSKLKADAKKAGEKLETEGKKLKDEYEAWKKRVEEHYKRTQEHFKKNQPEYLYDNWGMYPLL